MDKLFHSAVFALRVLLAGILAILLSSILDIQTPYYAIEAAVIGFSSYSFASLAETLVLRQSDSKNQEINDR